MNNTIVPAAIGAAGAIGVDYVLSAMPLPGALSSPALQPAVRIGAALLLGAAIGSLAGSQKVGAEAAAGGVVVTLYQWFSAYMSGYGGGQTLMGARLRRRRMGALGVRRRFRRFRPLGYSGNAMAVRAPRAMRHVALGYMGPGRTINGMKGLSRYTMQRYTR